MAMVLPMISVWLRRLIQANIETSDIKPLCSSADMQGIQKMRNAGDLPCSD
jgi:hypothetical protein